MNIQNSLTHAQMARQTAFLVMPDTHRRRRRDSTVEFRRVGGMNRIRS